MLCTSCGTENRDGGKFCDACGTPLPVACPSCGTENRPGAKFCNECGASLTGQQCSSPPRRQCLFTHHVNSATHAGRIAIGDIPYAEAERRQLTLMFCDLASPPSCHPNSTLKSTRGCGACISASVYRRVQRSMAILPNCSGMVSHLFRLSSGTRR